MPMTQQQFLQGASAPGGTTLSLSHSEAGVFISTVQTGTGSSQNIAHGLKSTPTAVVVAFTGSTASQAVTEGTHTSTNVVVTVTTGATFKVLAVI